MWLLGTMWQDLCYSARIVHKRLNLQLLVVFTLALGLGANPAVFAAVRGLLLRPLEHRESKRLVSIPARDHRQQRGGLVAALQSDQLRTAAKSLNGVELIPSPEMRKPFSSIDGSEAFRCARVSGNVLSFLRMRALRDRGFPFNVDSPGGTDAMMIGVRTLLRRFDGNSHLVGKCAFGSEEFGFCPAGTDVWVARPTEWFMIPALFDSFVSVLKRASWATGWERLAGCVNGQLGGVHFDAACVND